MPVTIVKLETPEAKLAAEAVAQNDGYCPCAVVKQPATKCMCREFRMNTGDPDWFGVCKCGLYEKVRPEGVSEKPAARKGYSLKDYLAELNNQKN